MVLCLRFKKDLTAPTSPLPLDFNGERTCIWMYDSKIVRRVSPKTLTQCLTVWDHSSTSEKGIREGNRLSLPEYGQIDLSSETSYVNLVRNP